MTRGMPAWLVLLLAWMSVSPVHAELILDLPLNEGEGTEVIDAAGSRPCTVTDATWITGPFGAALEFNGISSAATVPGDDALSPAHALTVSAWVKTHGLQPKLQRILQRASGTWGLYLGGARATFYTQTEGGKESWRSIAADVTIGEWVHWVGVYDGESMRLYLNGLLTGEAPQTGLLVPATPGAPLLLGFAPGGEQSLAGALSRVRIWDEALDELAVVAEYQASRRDYVTENPFPLSPSLLITFDEGQGEEAKDAGFAQNHARVTGGWVAGKFDTGLQAGTNGGAYVAADDSLNVQNAVTLEVWARQDSATKEMQRIAFRSSVYGLYTTGVPSGVTWYVNAGGEWSSVGAPLVQGRWVRITGTYDGAQLRLFYDGEEVASAPKTGAIITSSSPLLIAHGGRPQDTPFQGVIDELFVLGEAVSDFPERRSALLQNPESVPVRLVPYEADAGAGVPSIQIGRMTAPELDGRIARDEWAQAARLELRDAATGQPPKDTTVVRVGYDDEMLYAGYVCAESDVEGMQFVQEVTERDGPVWQDDCAEILIQPDPPDGEPFHFIVNPAGVVYDAAGMDKAYDSTIQTFARVDEKAREWTVEIAIPWKDLKADGPPVGREWRANFCREQYPQKTLQAWSPTRSFHRADRFGRVAWAEQPRMVEAGTVTVFGRIQRGSDRVAPNVSVRIGDRMAITRADGVFKIAGVPEGEVTLKAAPAPNYQPLAAVFAATAPTTIVVPPPLEKVDLQAHSLDLPDESPFHVLPLPVFEEPPLTGGPSPAFPDQPELRLTAARGEYEPVTFAVYARADLPDLAIAVSDLAGDGAAIPVANLELRSAARTMQRRWYTSPVTDSILKTRYLWPYEPEPLNAGQFRQYWLTLHVPDDAEAGEYRGAVTVSGGGHAVEVGLRANVLGLELRSNPDKRYGCYYRGSAFGKFADPWQHELPDIRAHGGDFLLWNARIGFSMGDDGVEISYDAVEQQIEIMREHGFRPPHMVWSGLGRLTALLESAGQPELIQPTATRAIQGLLDLAKERDWGEIYLTHMDEVFNEERLPRYIELTELIRNASDVTVYQTIRADRPDMMREADPYIDVRCYNGHNMDEWVSSGHPFEELAAELDAAGDEAWIYYNPRSVDVTPEWTRITNGLYMWLTPFELHTPWIYNSFGGSPFDAEDGHDFGYAFPSPKDGQPVPTMLWEAYREGVDDLRYIHTLETLIEAAGADDAQAKEAREYLDDLQARLGGIKIKKEASAVVKAWAEALTPDDWTNLRHDLARHIRALL